MDETAPGFYCTSQGAPSGAALPPGVTTEEGEGEGNEELEGENLVAQPRKVRMYVCVFEGLVCGHK